MQIALADGYGDFELCLERRRRRSNAANATAVDRGQSLLCKLADLSHCFISALFLRIAKFVG